MLKGRIQGNFGVILQKKSTRTLISPSQHSVMINPTIGRYK